MLALNVNGVASAGEAAPGPDRPFAQAIPLVKTSSPVTYNLHVDNNGDAVSDVNIERFEGAVRKITAKKGVDVVFEHVGAETFNGSLLSLKRGGRLVTCGATSGPSITFNLMQLFNQQYRIFGSFGASMRNIRDGLAKMAGGLLPVIDTEVALDDFGEGLARLESRHVFGKIIVLF